MCTVPQLAKHAKSQLDKLLDLSTKVDLTRGEGPKVDKLNLNRGYHILW
jgi:hypothetical protein